MRRLAAAAFVLALAAAGIFYVLTIPQRLQPETLSVMESGDAVRGERIFWAGGCASCHAQKGAKGEAQKELGGGLALATPFGTFHAPNISPHKENGIGGWSGGDFANAMLKGVSPQGSHYYPAFPFTSYARMETGDIADLWAFMKTLPAVAKANVAHQLPLPFRLRRGLGLWKLLFLSEAEVAQGLPDDPKIALGQYLVEGPGHCGECHTARNLIGGADTSRWLGGGPAPEGDGRIPNITPGGKNVSLWSEAEIASYLETGFTPDFDAVGGSMVEVQENMARLTAADRDAIAAYLKALPAVK
jgi:mono/diheme cytochrome c family protein